MIYLVDASPIIASCSKKELNYPDLLDLLAKAGHKLVIPPAVLAEIKRGPQSTISVLSNKINNGILKIENVSQDETERLGRRYPRLHDGELQVLLLALSLKKKNLQYCCVFDDGQARKTATKLELELTGTKGLLLMLNDIGMIDNKKRETLLKKLVDSKFRLK